MLRTEPTQRGRGLRERSHAPHHRPHRIDPALAELLLAARRTHPDWGPGKLLDWLAPRHPRVAAADWPAASTVGDLLARAGLVKLFIANALKQHEIGLEETDDGLWSIHRGTVLLGKVDEREMIVRD